MINRPSPGTSRRTTTWIIVMVTVATTAFAVRLTPVLAGGGLFGRGNYDDGVYYTAAAGFVHGLMPYRDFLLLHPPGIVLALAPFAALADLVGEPTAFAVARIGFMIIGSANAVLVAVALRRLGLAAAMVGGLTYAVFFPAVYVEHTTLLEPLATGFLLGAVSLIGSAPRSHAVEIPSGARAFRSAHTGLLRMIMAGVLLGVATAIKVWGVVPAVAMIAWVLATSVGAERSRRPPGTRPVPPRSVCRSSWRPHGRCGDWSCLLSSAARGWPAAGSSGCTISPG